MQTIVYFTAAAVPTTAELADIDKLNVAAETPYEVLVSSSLGETTYGGDPIECDFVAGTVPDDYSEIATIDPDNMPTPGLPPNQAVLTNGGAVSLLPATGDTPVLGASAIAIADGAVKGTRLTATTGVVTNGQVINVTGGTVTITVAANVVTATFTATP